MDFIVDFFKAVFVERDKSKIKDSITTIALIIIAFWVIKSYNNISTGIEENAKGISNLVNYRLVVISLSDSVFTVKSTKILKETDNRIENVIKLVQELDEKRKQEIDYITKYKDKSYEEIMDVLKLNEENWEFKVLRDRVETSFKIVEPESLLMSAPMEEITLQPIELKSIEESDIIEERTIAVAETISEEIAVTSSTDTVEIEEPTKPKRVRSDSTKNIFKTIGGWFKPID